MVSSRKIFFIEHILYSSNLNCNFIFFNPMNYLLTCVINPDPSLINLNDISSNYQLYKLVEINLPTCKVVRVSMTQMLGRGSPYLIVLINSASLHLCLTHQSKSSQVTNNHFIFLKYKDDLFFYSGFSFSGNWAFILAE